MISKLRNILAGLIAAASVFFASSADAGLKGLTDYNGGASVTIKRTAADTPDRSNFSTSAGSFKTFVSTDLSPTRTSSGTTSFETFCVDIYHYSNGAPGPNSVFAAVSLISTNTFSNGRNTGFGDAATDYDKAGFGRAAWIVNTFAYNTTLTSIQKSAIQVAIWKAEYEVSAASSADKKSLSAGTMRFEGLSSAIVTQAEVYLKASVAAGGGSAYATATATLVSYGDNSQDQIRAVPEPASMAMCGTALLVGTGLAVRRRKAKAAQA